METRTGDGISNSSQDSVHQSDKDIAQDHKANVSKEMVSSHSTRLHIKQKKKDVFQESDSDSGKDAPQDTRLNSLEKKDSCTSVNLKVGKRKFLQQVMTILFIQLVFERTVTKK